MKTYRFNGEGWYCDERSLFKRVRQWFIWLGGWESPTKGWQPIGKWSFQKKWWQGWHVRSVAPMSLLGHRFTYYGWGCQFKLQSGWLVIVWRPSFERGIYISKDGTPDDAHHWIAGTPPSVLAATAERQKHHDRIEELYAAKQDKAWQEAKAE